MNIIGTLGDFCLQMLMPSYYSLTNIRFLPLPYLKNAHAKPCLVNHIFIYDLSIKSTTNFCLKYHVMYFFLFKFP